MCVNTKFNFLLPAKLNMAGSSQKKTIQRNTATLTFLTTYTLVSLFLWVAIHLLMVFVLRQWPQVPSTGTLFLFTLQNSASIYIISCLRAWSRDGALDLGGKGVVEYLQDLGKSKIKVGGLERVERGTAVPEIVLNLSL